MKLTVKQGTQSQRVAIFVQDSSSTVGAGLTGLTSATGGLAWYYWREDEADAAGTAVSLHSMTRGTWYTGGLVEKDATNLPGFYEIGIPNAALAAGASWVVMVLRGAANMVPVTLEIQLVAQQSSDVYTELTAAIAELAQGVPTATPTMKQALMLLYMAMRNQTLTTASEYGIYNDAATKIAKAALSDDGTTFTRAKLASGA